MCLFSMWAVPCQWDKLCCCRSKYKYDYDQQPKINFKPYNNNKNKIQKLIRDFELLRKGTYQSDETQTNKTFCTKLIEYFRLCLLSFYLIFFFPLIFILFFLFLIYYFINILYLMIHGFITLYCCCNYMCCSEYLYSMGKVAKLGDYTYFTIKSSEVEEKRFEFYKMFIYVWSMTFVPYYKFSRYLAGFYKSELISDDIIIYFVHLWGPVFSKLVYEYDKNTNKPIRVRGIINDYSSWANKKSQAEFFDNYHLEVLSVFIDYDDECRITFTLSNGIRVKQPRFAESKFELNESQLNELRIWNITKAHYQCVMTMWCFLVHTWAHFHFNDLTLKYIETYWNDNMYDDDRQTKTLSSQHTVLNRIIRSHTYYTSTLNSAGISAGVANPQKDKHTWFTYICFPWKANICSGDVFANHVVKDVESHYFIPIDDEKDNINDDKLDNINDEKDGKDELLILIKDKKTANPDAFPPIFVQNRLQIFSDKKWCEMHRGYSIYRDFLADYYQVIYKDFVLKLVENNFITHSELEIYVNFLETNGFPGIINCNRNDNYLHILTTFVWLNIAHASDHTIGRHLTHSFGIGASYYNYKETSWYLNNKNYDFINVLSGKSIYEKWKLQFRYYRHSVMVSSFGGAKVNLCCVADYFGDSNLYHKFSDVHMNLNDEQRNHLNIIHDDFIQKISSLDESYGWLMPLNEFTAGVSY